jgi:hypothetical protein
LLETGTFNFVLTLDLRLLLHEYSEVTIIEKTTSRQQAELTAQMIHEIANKVHNWQDFI